MKNKRIIILIGNTETLEYFSLQLAQYFASEGREIFVWDMKTPVQSREAFMSLSDKEDSTLLTFNFIGLNGEGQFGPADDNIWDYFNIDKYVILVDSPVYYYRQLSIHEKRLKIACIDRKHKEFIEKWYPEYGEVSFIPLAGNMMLDSMMVGAGEFKSNNLIKPIIVNKDIAERPFDVAFIGNYVPPSELEPSLANIGPDYRAFIQDIAEELINNTKLTFEDTLERRLLEQFPDGSRDEYLHAMYQMIYIDLYVRSHFRGQAVKKLVDAGVSVYATGKDWDKLEVKYPEKLIHTHKSMNSLDCLRLLSHSKISLNVMPWFKYGAHDRIYSSQIMGCVALTDSSVYLDENLNSGVDSVIYSLDKIDELPCIVNSLLADNDKMQQIANSGRREAITKNTWAHRAQAIDI